MADLKDILNDDDDLKDDDLLKYLQGDLSKEELHKVEQQLANSPFASDAIEGLQSLPNKKNIDQYVDDLNRQLQKQVSQKKHKKEKRKLKDQPWVVLAVAAVLAICILCFFLIRYYQQNNEQRPPSIEQKK